MPTPSDRMVTPSVNRDRMARKTSTEGFWATKLRSIAQSPAARPLRAMMPRGRNWMKMMMKMIM